VISYVKTNEIKTDEQIHSLNVFLTRLLFCYFAEDTDIFGKENLFTNYIKTTTQENGSDVDVHIVVVFDTLNSDDANKAHHLKEFPYVNGGLFREKLTIPKFNYKSRKLLIECGGELNWSQINPDIFGSMIQAVISDEHRGGNGMHYTSVPNIMKVINPLFLDELKEEFEKVKGDVKKLNLLHKRIINIKLFDPACGSGNFLIIAYKELRKLEMRIFKSAGMLNMPSIELSNFYGIELDDFAHEVAILSLWLAQHQMNIEFKKTFGDCTPTLPLQDGGNIVQGNATRLEWDKVCPKNDGDEIYVFGNPPYLGSRNQKAPQKEDMKYLFKKDYKSLDYIACWFYQGANYIRDFNAKLAFVSTNSVSQGEQVALIWQRVLKDDIEIFFAYKSFKWKNNAKANAGVTVVVIGLANKSTTKKTIYKDELKMEVSSITPYLIQGKTIYIKLRTQPISDLPIINFGNMPADGGKLLFTTEEKNDFIEKEPLSEKWFKQLLSAHEFLNGKERWCLWLEDITENELDNMPLVKQRVEELKIIRENSSRPKLAEIPHLFAQITQPKDKKFILIVGHSSENRKYIPIEFFDNNYKANNSCFIIPTNQLYFLGILTSYMHMIWMKNIGGKLKTDYRYSKNVIYNTFPFPKITQTQKNKIEELVHIILDERDKNYTKTMAELYDPKKMPEGLKTAHHNLDLYIESCYRDKPGVVT